MFILGDFVRPKNEKQARHPNVIYEIGKLITVYNSLVQHMVSWLPISDRLHNRSLYKTY